MRDGRPCMWQSQRQEQTDPTFYPVVYSLPMDVDWQDEKNWYKVNPSLGYTVPIERMREAYLQSQDNPAEENVFRTLRLCQWVGAPRFSGFRITFMISETSRLISMRFDGGTVMPVSIFRVPEILRHWC